MEVFVEDNKVCVKICGLVITDSHQKIEIDADVDTFKINIEMIAVHLINSNIYQNILIGVYTLEHMEDLLYKFKYAQEKYYQ